MFNLYFRSPVDRSIQIVKVMCLYLPPARIQMRGNELRDMNGNESAPSGQLKD